MAYTPDNNPYIPGDPYSYDLKWIVDKMKTFEEPERYSEAAKASAEDAAASEAAAGLSAQAAADSAYNAHNSEVSAAGSADSAAENYIRAKDYVDDIADPVSGIVTQWLQDNITISPGVSIDTSLSVGGSAADAEATGDAISYNRALIGNINKEISFPEDIIWESGGINNSGVNIPSTSRCRSQNYIPWAGHCLIVDVPSGINVNVAAYDSTYTFLARVTGLTSTNNTLILRRDDVRYIRVYWGYSDDRTITPDESSIIKFRLFTAEGFIRRSVEKNYLHNITLDTSAVNGIKRFPGNLIDPSKVCDDCTVDYSNGNTSVIAGYILVQFVPVTAGVTYRANKGRNHAWFDSYYNYISGASGIGIQGGITAPVGAAYLSYNINKTADAAESGLDLYLAEESDFDPATYIDGFNGVTFWTAGKKVNWIGDSIVAGADFDELVCNRLGLVENDYGINGSTIGLKADGTDTRDAICDRYSTMDPTADIIIVSGGTNDYQYSWGTIGNIHSHDKTTFYGALNELCEGLINMYPDKVILFTTPIKRAQPFDGVTPTDNFSTNLNGYTLKQYSEIIKEVCSYYSIPCLDLWSESGLNPALASQQGYFDSALTHPTAAGQEIMARRVAGWIASLVVNP